MPRPYPGPRLAVGTLEGMSSETGTGPSLIARAIAVVVLIVAAYIVLKLVIGLVSALVYPVLLILAIVAIVWAVSVLR